MKLSDLKALCEKATKGPWEAAKHITEPEWNVYAPDDSVYANEGDQMVVIGYQLENNARFIAAARNAMPMLISVVEAVQNEMDDDWEMPMSVRIAIWVLKESKP